MVRNKKIIIVTVSFAFFLYVIYFFSQPKLNDDSRAGLMSRPILGTEEHYLGNVDAEVIIVKYSEPECPNCKRLHPILMQIVNEHQGNVALVYRHFPLASHQKSFVEAAALECITEMKDKAAFWEYLEKLYERTPSNNNIDLAVLPEIATIMGIPKESFEQCLEGDTHKARISRDINSGLAFDVDSVPQLFIFSEDDRVLSFRNRPNYATLAKTVEALINEKEI